MNYLLDAMFCVFCFTLGYSFLYLILQSRLHGTTSEMLRTCLATYLGSYAALGLVVLLLVTIS